MNEKENNPKKLNHLRYKYKNSRKLLQPASNDNTFLNWKTSELL